MCVARRTKAGRRRSIGEENEENGYVGGLPPLTAIRY